MEQVKEFEFTSKSYRLRKSARGNSYNVAVPARILLHHASTCGLSLEEFVKQYEMVAKYVDDRPGFMIYEFKKI